MRHLLVCLPVAWTDVRDPGDFQTRCHACGVAIWQAAEDSVADSLPTCLPCAYADPGVDPAWRRIMAGVIVMFQPVSANPESPD